MMGGVLLCHAFTTTPLLLLPSLREGFFLKADVAIHGDFRIVHEVTVNISWIAAVNMFPRDDDNRIKRPYFLLRPLPLYKTC